jgi:Tfp pilus assembly protein PilN
MTVDTQLAPAPAVVEPGPVATRVEWAIVPRVNLLPPEVLAARRFRSLQRRLGVVVASTLVVAGIGVVWAQSGLTSAEDDLAATRAQAVQLQAEQTKYAEAPKVLANLDAARTARASALGTDVAWYQFLSDLAINTPGGTGLSSVAISMDGTVNATASTVPLVPAGLGEVKVTGKAVRFPDVATWLDSFGQVHGLAGIVLMNAAQGNPDSGSSASAAIDYTGSAVITTGALSHRYDRRAN